MNEPTEQMLKKRQANLTHLTAEGARTLQAYERLIAAHERAGKDASGLHAGRESHQQALQACEGELRSRTAQSGSARP